MSVSFNVQKEAVEATSVPAEWFFGILRLSVVSGESAHKERGSVILLLVSIWDLTPDSHKSGQFKHRCLSNVVHF